MSEKRHLVFVWHLHQPYYGIPKRKDFVLPWVRLHGTKSYFDMVWLLKKYPKVRGTFNFSGVLLKQIEEYVEHGRRDEWWNLTIKPTESLNESERRFILQNFFSCSWDRCIDPYPRYKELLNRRGRHTTEVDPRAFSVQDFRDLKVWFTLAWMGFAATAEYPLVGELRAKAVDFTEEECQQLLTIQIEILSGFKHRYRELAAREQIEISITPMYHPIVPLILDTDAAAIATPNRPRPRKFSAREDAEYHIREGLALGRQFFQIPIIGMWPSEGSVSPEAVEVFAQYGVKWIATDEDVLRASRGYEWSRDHNLYRPWTLGSCENSPVIFFRDHFISDQIGFVYSKNTAEGAVADLMHRIHQIPEGRTVSIILDGENPWEYYPNDGCYFLERLYSELSSSSTVESTTPGRLLAAPEESEIYSLGYLHSGSWIHGNYQIWIGHNEENRAWDLLNKTRRDLVQWEKAGENRGNETAYEGAWDAIHAAEGSDWFWWFGDDFQTIHDSDFDRIFRYNLIGVYTLTGHQPPVELSQSIGSSESAPAEITAPYALIRPVINGRSVSFYKWQGSGVYHNTGGHGAMFENTRRIASVRVGYSHETLFVRAEPTEKTEELEESLLRIDFQVHDQEGHSEPVRQLTLGTDHAELDGLPVDQVEVAMDECFEVAIPFELVGIEPGQRFDLLLALLLKGVEVERLPTSGMFHLSAPDASFEGRNWFV